MTALLTFLAGAFTCAALGFAGGWFIRELRDKMRGEFDD